MKVDEFVAVMTNDVNHRPLLWLALEATKGRVLELGLGHGSTPFLHHYCHDSSRELLSVETSLAWFSQFKHFRSELHRIVCIDLDSTEFKELTAGQWSVVLVDHAPGERRPVDMHRLMDHVDIFVCHDTEDHAGSAYTPIWRAFKYRCDITVRGACAAAVSNSFDVSQWRGQTFGQYEIS